MRILILLLKEQK